MLFYLKVGVAFGQVLMGIGSTFSIELPTYFKTFLELFKIASLESSLLVPEGCLASAYKHRLLFHSLAPLALSTRLPRFELTNPVHWLRLPSRVESTHPAC